MPKYKGEGEVWRQSLSVPRLLVSNEGRVMVRPYRASLPRGGSRSYGGQPHYGIWNKAEARFIIVYKGKSYKIHSLVCEAFHGARPEIDGRPAVCMHLDENSANNRASNLAWGSQKENLNAPGFKEYCSHRDHARMQIEHQDSAVE